MLPSESVMASVDLRRIKVNGIAYRYRVHQRALEAGQVNVFSAFAASHPRAALRILFPASAEHGTGYIEQDGVVLDHREPRWEMNLHRPKAARVLIETGIAAGWKPEEGGLVVENGFDLVRAHPKALVEYENRGATTFRKR